MGDGNEPADVTPDSSIDVNKITDVTQLKALAYDQMAALQQAQNNLAIINQRIEQLSVTIQ